MPTALRDIYLTIMLLLGTGVVIAPYLGGIALPAFPYLAAGGKTVIMPVSVALYALFLLIAIAALAKRLLAKGDGAEVSDAR